MTCICFSKKHKQLASDSQTTLGSRLKFNTGPKIFSLPNGGYLACAGDADERDVLSLFEKCEDGEIPSRKQLRETETDFQGILVYPSNNKVYAIFIESYGSDEDKWYGSIIEVEDQYVALGCGLEFAYAVLENGGSPKEAVEAACARDLFCGLPVQVVNLEPPAKKTKRKQAVSEQ